MSPPKILGRLHKPCLHWTSTSVLIKFRFKHYQDCIIQKPSCR